MLISKLTLMDMTKKEENPKLLNTKDYIMLAITLGGMVVSVTAWGYSLKGSIDLNKQAVENLAVAQKEANENVKSLAVRQTDTEKDVISIQKDLESVQKKTLSYNTTSKPSVNSAQTSPFRVEAKSESKSTREEKISPATQKEEESDSGSNLGKDILESLGIKL